MVGGVIAAMSNPIVIPDVAASAVDPNAALFEALERPGMEQAAIDAVNNFTRTKMREDGFYRKIIQTRRLSTG